MNDKVFCKEINFLTGLLGVLLFMASLYLIFGWGTTKRQPEIEREMVAGQQQPGAPGGAPMQPEIERQQGVLGKANPAPGAGAALNGRRPQEFELVGPMPGNPPQAGDIRKAGPQNVQWGLPDATDVGASVYPIDPFTKKSMGLRGREGVIVYAVGSGSLAEAAGLKPDDVIKRLAHKKIESANDIAKAVRKMVPGRTYRFRILREGRVRKLYFKYEPMKYDNRLGPIDGVLPVAVKVKTKTKKVASWLGADVQDIDPMLQKHLGLPNQRGAVVSFIEKDAPAKQAGLMRGDVIKQFGNKKIINVADLKQAVERHKPGDRVRLNILRGNKVITPYVTLTNKPMALVDKPAMLPGAEVEVEAAWLGMGLSPLTKAEAQELGLPAKTTGMVVEGIQKGPASKAGFKIGDVILAANGTKITGLQAFTQAAEDAQGAVLDVMRNGKHLYISIPPPQPFKTKNGQAMQQVATRFKTIAIGSTGETLFDQVAADFDKAPFYLIYNPNNGTFEVMKNGFGQVSRLSIALLERRVSAVITGNMDKHYAQLFGAERIKVYAGVFGTVFNAVGMYKAHKLIRAN